MLLHVREAIEREVPDFFLIAQLREFGLGEDVIRLDGRTEIRVAVSDVRDAIAFRS